MSSLVCGYAALCSLRLIHKSVLPPKQSPPRFWPQSTKTLDKVCDKVLFLREPLSTLKRQPPSPRKILEVSNLQVRRGPARILAGITWTVRAGEHWVILG